MRRAARAPPEGSPGTPSALRPQAQGEAAVTLAREPPSSSKSQQGSAADRATTKRARLPAGLGKAIPSVLSGLVCGLILFVFCCVFSSMIFQVSPLLAQALPLGVGMHTVSTLVGSLVQ